MTDPVALIVFAASSPATHPDLLGDLRRQGAVVAAAAAAEGLHPVYVDSAQPSTSSGPLDDANAVIVLGGGDVHPQVYGQAMEEALYGVDEAVDAFEVDLTIRAIKAGVPVLAICRGMQVLNVALGGTLTQDLGPASIHKTPGAEWGFVEHEVHLRSASVLSGSSVR